jgi:transposase
VGFDPDAHWGAGLVVGELPREAARRFGDREALAWTATALIGAVNHIHAFRRGREFASWLGLTPRESSTGGRRFLGRISKRGDVHLRCLLAHGARAVLRSALRTAQRTPDRLTRLQQWAVTTAATHRGRNKATISLANKLARIVWAVWCRDEEFQARPPLTTAA